MANRDRYDEDQSEIVLQESNERMDENKLENNNHDILISVNYISVQLDCVDDNLGAVQSGHYYGL